jgi:hypothetical protein
MYYSPQLALYLPCCRFSTLALCVCFLYFFFKTGSHYVAQAGLEFVNLLLSASQLLGLRCMTTFCVQKLHNNNLCLARFSCLFSLKVTLLELLVFEGSAQLRYLFSDAEHTPTFFFYSQEAFIRRSCWLVALLVSDRTRTCP